MKKNLALMAAVAAFISAPALANEGNVEAKAQHYFDKMDTDNNDQISKAEHDAFGDTMFKQADSNADGNLTMAEMTAAKQKEKSEMKNTADKPKAE